MKRQINPSIKAHLVQSASYLLLLSAGTLLAFLRPGPTTSLSQRTLTFAQRVEYQRAIEEVYWRHRIWPKENLNPKPSLDAVMSQAQIEKKVADYLRNSQALEDYWQRPITAEDLQAEMDRMAENTKQPEVLRELFEALGNDPFFIAECLVRPVLSERLITSFAQGQQKDPLVLSEIGANNKPRNVILTNTSYVFPTISDATTGCTPDSWAATSTTNAPEARDSHTAVWTGSEMIVWGGVGAHGYLNTGGRYNPSTDTWTATSTVVTPAPRQNHTAVWTGSEMIVWGGFFSDGNLHWLNTGGRYDPGTDSWTATSTTNAPDGRYGHTAVWTDSETVVWAGVGSTSGFNTGGRYNPSIDNWTATSTTGAPSSRWFHTAVWTASEMIVWGGRHENDFVDTGGRYNPRTDSWAATSTVNAPDGREFHTAVWTGSEMIVWGGYGYCCPPIDFNTGGRYCAQSGALTPTPTPTATAAPTATATPTATPTSTPTPTPTPTPCTGRCTPTPRPRPTPARRP
jgi:N-acetylneuraminic acid mutarotase